MEATKRPTLLQINVTCNWGSTGRIAEEIGATALSRGWRSIIAYGRYHNASRSETYHIGSLVGEAWHLAATRLLDRHGLESRLATQRLVSHIMRWKPDIIHLHNVHGYYLNYPRLFRFLADYGRPVVWTLHDCWSFTGHCPHFELAQCFRWRDEGCHDCPNRRIYPASLLADRSARNFRDKQHWFTRPGDVTLVPVSEWLARYARQSFLGRYPVCCIHNGIDTTTFRPTEGARQRVAARYGLRGQRLVIGVASVWEERKGLADFLSLRALLPADCDILLVGLKTHQLRHLPRGVHGLQRTNNVAELADIYTAADAFFNPTMEEALSLVNLEAQSCGTPVVTYRTGGAPETISDGQTGHVVAQHDLRAAAKAIAALCAAPHEPLARACRSHIIRHFRKEDRYADYLSLYDQLLAEEGGGQRSENKSVNSYIQI